MRIKMLLLIVLFTSFVAAQAGASVFDVVDCNTLFTTGTTGATSIGSHPLVSGMLASRSTPTGMLELSITIVLLVLTVLGIVYAIGMAFGINKLTTFVKAEYLESIANLAIIVMIVGGIGVFDGSMTFLANLAGASVTGTGSTQSANIVNAGQLYQNLCNNYENGIVMSNVYTYIPVFYELFIYNAIISFKVNLMPTEFGITFSPWYGAQTLRTAVWSEMDITFSIIIMGLLVIFTLFIVYYLFPVFLYAGLALRAFPWTRAAGGSLIALFISFYVVFPAFLYAFSAVLSPSAGGSAVCISSPTLCSQSNVGNAVGQIKGNSLSAIEALAAVADGNVFGDVMYQDVMQYASTITYAVFQMGGLIISFLVSYDLLEFLGDVLGAPSLQSNRLLQKVI